MFEKNFKHKFLHQKWAFFKYKCINLKIFNQFYRTLK